MNRVRIEVRVYRARGFFLTLRELAVARVAGLELGGLTLTLTLAPTPTLTLT
jgi:hypothetical protein